eukprot:40407_1
MYHIITKNYRRFNDGRDLFTREEKMFNGECCARQSLRPLFCYNGKVSSLYEVAYLYGNEELGNLIHILPEWKLSKDRVTLRLYSDPMNFKLPDHDNHPKTNINITKHPLFHMGFILKCVTNVRAKRMLKSPISLWPFVETTKTELLSCLLGLLGWKPVILYRMICKNELLFDVFILGLKCSKDTDFYQPIFVVAMVLLEKYIIPWIIKKNMFVLIHVENEINIYTLRPDCIDKRLRFILDIVFPVQIWDDKLLRKKLEEKIAEKKNIACGNYLCQKRNTSLKFKVCKGCNVMFYCSRKCQKYDWNVFKHSFLCNMINDIF